MNNNGKTHVLVIGGGPGGYPAAIKAAQLGADVTLVDRDGLGGTCLHRGCIPTKFLLKSAKDYAVYNAYAKKNNQTAAPPDAAELLKKKSSVVRQLTMGTGSLLKKNGVRVIAGTAVFEDKNTVVVKETGERIQPTATIIATGSRVIRPPIPGMDLTGVVDSDSILDLDRIPKSLVVIGGGYIGLEFSQIFNTLGAEVNVVEMLPGIIPTADAEAAQAMQKILTGTGISITTGSTVRKIETDPGGLCLTYEHNGEEKAVTAEMVLVAVGRAPQLEGLNIAAAGIRAEKNGTVTINAKCETGVAGIYAVGDVTGGLMLAHKASAEGECAAMNACGRSWELPYDVIPSVMYTFPEMASVGLTEEAAGQRHGELRIGRFPFAANGRAVLSGDANGFVKVIADAETDCIVGTTIIGPEAGHLIGEAALAIQMEATMEEVAETVHAHPTLSEAFREACLEAKGEAIHIPPG